jgi:hypothetical protein
VTVASHRLLLAAALVSCAAAALLVAVAAPGPARLVAVLALLCLAPGAAVLPRRAAEPGLVVGLGLAVAVVGGQAMLWLGGALAPALATYVLAGLAAPVLVARLARREARLP